MTRIIAGFAGSLTLTVPGTGTRPTSDRVREAIFSALDSRNLLVGARVLDLYAGSGALGLEAASRGAAHVMLVERDARAARVCRANAARVLEASAHPPAVQVVARSVAASLASASVSASASASASASTSGLWDVAFLDPPYEFSDEDLAADLALLVPLLAADAVVLVERATRSPEPRWPAGLTLDRSKKHGDTTLWWARGA